MFLDFTDWAGDRLTNEVKERTPIGEIRVRDWKNRTYVAFPSGRLKRSIEKIDVRPTDEGFESGAKSDLEYASFVEDDTEPHRIRAVNYKFLSIHQAGHIFLSTAVDHPGTTGQHMFALGCEELEVILPSRMDRSVIGWAKKAGL